MQPSIPVCIGLAALCACAATAEQTLQRPAWTAQRTCDVPEAHQAAAADERFFFAVASKSVAKYDRESALRIATSTGAAEHLNSGFLWQGKLYCAHSNYPQTPEQSDIKVLNTETMQLSTFKNFGNNGGSLTWAVRENGHWWCNFARYGADNAQTFLCEFDERWQELSRWTYPAELVRQIGRMSISGGIWHEGALLVTDHDHPALYRLRLPSAGTVLQLVATETAPFTGQGIAVDPVTQGVVGIHRAQRQVIFAVRSR